jgi:hypothetical protein
MATTRRIDHGHAHHADCGSTNHCHGDREHKYHAHHESDTCTKVVLLSVLIAAVGTMLWFMNRQH